MVVGLSRLVKRDVVTPFLDVVDLRRAGCRKAFAPVGVLDTVSPGGMLCMEFSPDGKRLCVIHPGRPTEVWNTETAQPVSTLEGSRVLTRTEGTLRLWDVESCSLTGIFRSPDSPKPGWSEPQLSPDGRRVLWRIPGTGEPMIWEPGAAQWFRMLQHRDEDELGLARFSPDGEHIIWAGNKILTVWSADTGECVHSFIPRRLWGVDAPGARPTTYDICKR